METTVIYKVYGCDTCGELILYAEFYDLKPACQCAVANHGKIHYDLPEVHKYTYQYNEETKTVIADWEIIEPAQIYYMSCSLSGIN